MSQLKQYIKPPSQVQTSLPSPNNHLQIPLRVLKHRVRCLGDRTMAQALVEWSDSSPQEATWEDIDSLKQQFPRAPAWAQAGFQ